MQGEFPIEALQKMVDRLEDKLDKRLDKIESKMETISDATIKNTLVLDEHIRRTEAAEASVDLLFQKLELQRQEYTASLANHEGKSAARAAELEKSQSDLADSVELFVKGPKLLYRAAKWLAGIVAGGSACYAIVKGISSVLTHVAAY